MMKVIRIASLLLAVLVLALAAPLSAQMNAPQNPPAADSAGVATASHGDDVGAHASPAQPPEKIARDTAPPAAASGAGGILPGAPSPKRGRAEHAADWKFWTANQFMFSSSIANAELTTRCMAAGACKDVPDPLRSRAALYGVGLPADIAVGYVSYRLKRAGHRWWFVPSAIVTAGNVIYSVHAARMIR